MKLTVSEVMTRGVEEISAAATLEQAAKQMKAQKKHKKSESPFVIFVEQTCTFLFFCEDF